MMDVLWSGVYPWEEASPMTGRWNEVRLARKPCRMFGRVDGDDGLKARTWPRMYFGTEYALGRQLFRC